MGAVELNYKEYGGGDQCLIILHGLLGMLDNWHSMATRYGEKMKVFTIDQRDHGRSPHTDELSYPLMAEDLFLFIEQNAIEKINLMGHSMGGKTAMFFANQYPDLIEKLLVVDMFPFKGSGGHLEVFESLSAIDIRNLKSRKEADEILSFKISDIGLRQFLLKNIDRNPDGGYCWKMNLKTIFNSYDKISEGVPQKSVDVPTLFIKGANSPYIKAEDLNRYRLIFPQAKLGVIENAGHWVHADKPEEFFKLSSEFILGN